MPQLQLQLSPQLESVLLPQPVFSPQLQLGPELLLVLQSLAQLIDALLPSEMVLPLGFVWTHGQNQQRKDSESSHVSASPKTGGGGIGADIACDTMNLSTRDRNSSVIDSEPVQHDPEAELESAVHAGIYQNHSPLPFSTLYQHQQA